MQDAALALGISISGVRRGLKSGRLKGQRKATPQGHQWLVEVPDEQAVTGRSPGTRVVDYPAGHRVSDQADTRVVDKAVDPPPPEAQGATERGNLATRAEDMAVYSHRLLAPYVAQIAEQAEEIGRLRAELAAALANGRAETQSAPQAGWPERRPWWQRLLFG